MKRLFNFVAPLVLLVGLAGCSCEMVKKEPVPFVIVNVLDKEFFDDCHIKGSIQVPFEQIEEYALKHWNKDKTHIVVHCSNYKCTASGESERMLTKLGFKHVWAYEAGTAEALQLGIEVEGPCRERYLQDYKRPEGLEIDSAIKLITTDELKKKIEYFYGNK